MHWLEVVTSAGVTCQAVTVLEAAALALSGGLIVPRLLCLEPKGVSV